MKRILKMFVPMLLVVLCVNKVDGQEKPEWKQHPNNIKFNASSGLLYKNAIIFGYERTVGPHQTVSVFGGTQQLPSFAKLIVPGVAFQRQSKAGGFNVGAEYRFYLASENKHAPPHGFYIGPYASYYSFKNDNQAHITLDDGSTADGSLHTDFHVASVGAQLGYQFVFWKRMTLDLILFGPSLTHYSGHLDLKSNLDPAKVPDEIKKIVEAIGERYPVIGEAIKNGSADANGKVGIWGPGFRYSVHVGFRF